VHTAKRPALRRIFLIDRELRAGRYPTATRLAELCEVNDKTVRRDLDYLAREYRAPVAFNPAHNGWEYTEPTYRLPAVLITEGELLAIFLAGQTLKQHAGTPYEPALRRAIDKLTELLPDEVSLHWHAVEQAHSFHQTVTTLQDVELFRQLADAVLQRRQVRVTYWTASREAESERLIDPWHLACVDGSWYVIGWCGLRQGRRMFAVNRIRALEPTGASFVVPDDFRIGEFFDGTFRVVADGTQPLQTVRLRFAPSAGKYIREKIWHVSQRLEVLPDGGVLLELSLRSLVEVRRWILSWGGEVEVLEPAGLRDDIRREAAAILAHSAAIPQEPERVPSRTLRGARARKKSG
jgi:predicted DNA-binding transcriptional regulator YafY